MTTEHLVEIIALAEVHGRRNMRWICTGEDADRRQSLVAYRALLAALNGVADASSPAVAELVDERVRVLMLDGLPTAVGADA